jgi:hypothetical protein
VLKSALVKFRTYYAAIEQIATDGKRVVFAEICLVDYGPARADPMRRFGYKDMDETDGAIEAECPASILDLLTPTEYKNALDWRNRCRTHIARKDAFIKPKHGDRVHFETPVFFGGHGFSDFIIEMRPCERTVRFSIVGSSAICRIRHWQDRPHTVTPAQGRGVGALAA